MKPLIRLTVLRLLFCALTAHANDWARSWQAGYREGYRVEAGDFSIPPIPPIAPIPPVGRNTDTDGYAEDILAGAEAARCRH